MEADEVSEAIETIATRLIGASTELSGLCATACENMSEVVTSAELDEENSRWARVPRIHMVGAEHDGE